MIINAEILIESKWNLKLQRPLEQMKNEDDINRIKVEFKGNISVIDPTEAININRIKVEFKALFYTLPSGPLRHINRIKVEFKVGLTNERIPESFYINRIKVEFKVCCSIFNAPRFSILIESKWNLKKISV